MTTVCCKLPNGITIELGKNKIPTKLNGINKTTIIGSTHGSTEVNSELWAEWVAENKDFPPFKSGAIFSAKNQQEAAAVAKDLAEVTTGLEPMKKQDDKRAKGIKPAVEAK